MAINITDQIISICKETVGRAYRAWPQTAPATPYAVVSLIGRNVEQADADGSEIIVRMTFSIGIMADRPSEAEDTAMRVADALATYNFHSTGFSGTYEEPNHFYRTNLTVDGAVDRRGNTFV